MKKQINKFQNVKFSWFDYFITLMMSSGFFIMILVLDWFLEDNRSEGLISTLYMSCGTLWVCAGTLVYRANRHDYALEQMSEKINELTDELNRLNNKDYEN